MKLETYTVAQLIQVLTDRINEREISGEEQVFISSDEEGNSFGTVLETSLMYEKGKFLVLYPIQERLEGEDIGLF